MKVRTSLKLFNFNAAVTPDAVRLEGIAKSGAICLSDDAYRQVRGRLDLTVSDLGATQLRNITEPVRVYSLEVVNRRQRSRPGSRYPGRCCWAVESLLSS